jgi:excisionase family DNA binding protein
VVPARDALLTAREVAQHLGVCRDTVYELCAKGELPHARVLNAIRIASADVEAFLSRNRKDVR